MAHRDRHAAPDSREGTTLRYNSTLDSSTIRHCSDDAIVRPRLSRLTSASDTRTATSALGALPAISLAGPLAEGIFVTLGWPEADEYDRITALRNRPAVRACFFDPRPLDPLANREWIAHRMQRPREGLLSIRIGPHCVFCGTIGWSGYDPDVHTLEIGRLVVDAALVRPFRSGFPDGYPGVALDASNALLEFAFTRMGVERVTSVFLAERALPRRVNILCGGRHAGDSERVRPDGSRVRVSCMALTRAEWSARLPEPLAPAAPSIIYGS